MSNFSFEAVDENGKKFPKVAKIRNILSFGWPCEYDVENLLRDYPFTKPLCIDGAGRNHSGVSVYVSAEIVNKLLEPFVKQEVQS